MTTTDWLPLVGTVAGASATLAVIGALWWFLLGVHLRRRRSD